MKKFKKILFLAALPLVLVGCTNKSKNTEVLEALNVEYNVPSGKVTEMTGYEFEPDTECYIVEYDGKTYYVALMKNGTDADDNLDSFLALHQMKFDSFETKNNDETLNGDLYKSNQYNNYYFVTDSNVYMITFTKTSEGKKEPLFNDLNCEKINDDTWAYQSLGNINYILLLNDGQELIITTGDYTYVYIKTDHIEMDEVVS